MNHCGLRIRYILLIAFLFVSATVASEKSGVLLPTQRFSHSKQEIAEASSRLCWGIGPIVGIHSAGIQGRLWIRDVVGGMVTTVRDYRSKAGGARLQLLYKMPLNKRTAPYFTIGGGVHLKKVDTLFKNLSFSKWVNMRVMTVGGGIEGRLGKKRIHAVSLELVYQKGQGYYTHTHSALGDASPTTDTITVLAPSFNSSLLYSFYPQKRDREKDSDRDGLFDIVDLCPYESEDLDGFMDSDGCPDWDNDGDGIMDTLDNCLNEAEDQDGILDDDGCPDLDNDFDGIDDEHDRCPSEKEDIDGYEDSDGCPDLDNDADKLLDTYDQCPDIPEDFDGFEDVDGCPDPDNDGDGFADAHDKCPHAAEIKNGYLDDDGCPDTVYIITTASRVIEGIHFRGNSAQLHESSFLILDEIVKTLRIWPDIKVEISGHTDAMGEAKRNKRLSENRAQSVRDYLISQGVEDERVKVRGYGKDRPIAHNSSAAGRAKNRRIEIQRID